MTDRKVGRSKNWCKQYYARDRQTTNKERKIRQHLRRNPTDAEALTYFENNFRTFDRNDLLSRGRHVIAYHAWLTVLNPPKRQREIIDEHGLQS